MAAQLRHRWNVPLWAGVSRLLAEGDPFGPIQRSASPPKQLQKRLLDERWDEITTEYLEGASANALSRKYGIHWQTVLNQLRKRNIEIRHQQQRT